MFEPTMAFFKKPISNNKMWCW